MRVHNSIDAFHDKIGIKFQKFESTFVLNGHVIRQAKMIQDDGFITGDLADELREAFTLFDHNNDGHIDRGEFVSSLRSLGHDHTQTDVADMLRDIGAHNKRELSFEDFSHFIHKKMQATEISEQIKEVFAMLDYNNKSCFTARELAAVIREIGDRMTDVEAADLIDEANTKEPGVMDRGEFNDLVKRLIANK